MNRIREALLDYHSRCWKPLLICPPDHKDVGVDHLQDCTSPGKMPLHRWRHASLGLPELLYLLQRRPSANLGITLGTASGVVGVDVDSEEGWDWLTHVSVGLPPGPRFSTGRGVRLLFAQGEPDAGGGGSFKLARGVDVLGEGRCTVMPPSIHASGKPYKWLEGFGPELPLPAFPLELADRRDRQTLVDQDPYLGDRVWEEGTRNRRLFVMGCVLRRYGASLDEITACLHVFNRRCSPPLPLREVEQVAVSACKYKPEVEG